MRKILASLILVLALFAGSFAFPIATRAYYVAPQSGNPNVTVWVNTNSGVYHCPGTRWYGNTESGRYMSQRAARASGYRPAYGNVCG
jgi:hypothetical protein